MELARGIDAFPPLAYQYRMYLFGLLGSNWARERARHPAEASRLLDWADREAAAALGAEPVNWRNEHALARMYAEVARTDPEYGEKARMHLARARELAPNRAVFARPLVRPAALGAKRRPEGAVALRWRPAPGAGYHEIQRSADGRGWSTVLYAWEAARTELVTRACAPCRYGSGRAVAGATAAAGRSGRNRGRTRSGPGSGEARGRRRGVRPCRMFGEARRAGDGGVRDLRLPARGACVDELRRARGGRPLPHRGHKRAPATGVARGLPGTTRAAHVALRLAGLHAMVTSRAVMQGTFSGGLRIGVIPMHLVERGPLGLRRVVHVPHVSANKRAGPEGAAGT